MLVTLVAFFHRLAGSATASGYTDADRNAVETFCEDYRVYLVQQNLGEGTAVLYRNALRRFLLEFEQKSRSIPPFRIENLIHEREDEPVTLMLVGQVQDLVDAMGSSGNALNTIKALRRMVRFLKDVAQGTERDSGIIFSNFRSDEPQYMRFIRGMDDLDEKITQLR